MGLVANQMLMEAVHKIAEALKDKKTEKNKEKTKEHEAGQSPSANKGKTNRK